MGKVAGAQNFDGRNWHEQHIAKRTRAALDEQDRAFAERHAGDPLAELAGQNWPVICGAAPNIGDGPLPHVRSSAEAILQNALAVGRTLCGRRT